MNEKSDILDMGILADDIGFQIHITRRAIWNLLRTTRDRKKPREPSGYVASLILIGANPGITQSEIADALVLDMPNLATILSLMSERGLIERTQSEEDRRRFSLKLTAAGQEALEHAMQVSEAQRQRISRGLTEEESARLVQLLHKLQLSLKDSGP